MMPASDAVPATSVPGDTVLLVALILTPVAEVSAETRTKEAGVDPMAATFFWPKAPAASTGSAVAFQLTVALGCAAARALAGLRKSLASMLFHGMVLSEPTEGTRELIRCV